MHLKANVLLLSKMKTLLVKVNWNTLQFVQWIELKLFMPSVAVNTEFTCKTALSSLVLDHFNLVYWWAQVNIRTCKKPIWPFKPVAQKS
ncbi:hypothetical protein D3C71_1554370 [compost metagenome]